MPWKRLLGIMLTMTGIFWYTHLTLQQAPSKTQADGSKPASGSAMVDSQELGASGGGREVEKQPLLQLGKCSNLQV